MEHEADARGEEIQIFPSEVVAAPHFCSRFGAQGPVNDADVDARFFEHFALGEDPASTSAALFSRPLVFPVG